jgi:anti-anti-sigma factor
VTRHQKFRNAWSAQDDHFRRPYTGSAPPSWESNLVHYIRLGRTTTQDILGNRADTANTTTVVATFSDHRSPMTTPSVWLIIAREPGAVAVRLHGTLDSDASDRLRIVLRDLIDGPDEMAIELDVRGLRSLDPAGLEVVATASAALARRGGTLTMTGSPAELLLPVTTTDLATGTFPSFSNAEPPGTTTATLRILASRSRHPAGARSIGQVQEKSHDPS